MGNKQKNRNNVLRNYLSFNSRTVYRYIHLYIDTHTNVQTCTYKQEGVGGGRKRRTVFGPLFSLGEYCTVDCRVYSVNGKASFLPA